MCSLVIKKMQPKLVLVGVGSVCVYLSYFLALGDVVFVQMPQNLTISNLEEPFFLNCSTNVASKEGMDWQVRMNGNLERICSSRDFYEAGPNSCQLNYSMEVPNNRTLNLIVNPRIAILGNEYCCQFDNGAGKKSCSYLNISLATYPAVTDNTTDITTVFPHKTITEPENSHDNDVTIKVVVGMIIALIAIGLAAVASFFIWKNRTTICRSKGSPIPVAKDGTPSSVPLSQPAQPKTSS